MPRSAPARTIREARVLFAVAERIESRPPDLVGGLSADSANAADGSVLA